MNHGPERPRGSMIPENGSLGDIPAFRIFLSVFEKKETGILHLKKGNLLKILYFNEGKFTWSFSNSEEDRLESMLLSRNMMNDHALKEIKRNPEFLSSPGRILVETGQITFEQLIFLTCEQLQQIFSSVLLWTEGDFRFVHGAPPNRLVLHQLEIPQFIYRGLTGKVDREMVERDVGPLELQLVKTSEVEKLNHYPLTPEQNQILEAFGGGERMDAIVSRFSANGEETLQLIYFLFLLELLARREVRPDTVHARPQEQIREVSDDKPLAITLNPDSPPADEMERMEKHDTPPGVKPPISEEDPSRPNRFRFLLIAVFLVLAMISLVGVLTTPTSRNQPAPPAKIPPPDIPASRPVAGVQPKGVPPVSNQEIGVQKSNKPQPGPEGKPEAAITTGDDSSVLFTKGRLTEAAEQWKREFRRSPAAYSIFLELDCQKDSVLDAYDRISRRGDFFILPRRRSGKTCFLVLWGKFATQNEAAAALKEIPPSFFLQRDPPRIVALAIYL
jgi:hypothetical protein